MNPLELLFRVGPAIKTVFELGYEPKEELFYELTADQYEQLERSGQDTSKRWFTIIPTNQKHDVPEVLIIDADGAKALLDAARYINHICTEAEPPRQFSSFDDKLKYAATQLPSVFSQSSKYPSKEAPILKIVK